MNRDYARRAGEVLVSAAAGFASLFLCAGTVRWLWPWLLMVLTFIILTINFFLLPAELIAERGRRKENLKKWDRVIVSLLMVPSFGIYIVCGLDYRFGWSGRAGQAVNYSGLLFFFLGYMLVTWAMMSNEYFSTMVRIQAERGHSVAYGGPYRFIRHPGYLGFIISTASFPLALGTFYGFSMSLLTAVLITARTNMEDRTLKAELEGYAEYAREVRYRLIPLVW